MGDESVDKVPSLVPKQNGCIFLSWSGGSAKLSENAAAKIGKLPRCGKLHRKDVLRRNIMKRPLVSASNVATAAGVLIAGFLGYVFFSSLPDLRRYVRISTM